MAILTTASATTSSGVTGCWHVVDRGRIGLVDMGKVWKTCALHTDGGCPTSGRESISDEFLILELRVCTSLTVTPIMMFLIVSVELATVAHVCRR